MNKQSDYLSSYTYLDSQRLRDTFFSPRAEKTSSRKIIILSSIITTIILIISVLLFFLNYDIVIVPRKTVKMGEETTSLFHTEMLSSIRVIGKDKQLMKVKASSIYSTVPFKEKIGMTILLKKPIDLRTNCLLLSVKNAYTPLKIGVIIRDTRFFSNSLNPLLVEVKKEEGFTYTQIPVIFDNVTLQNTNPYRVKQITFYFYPQYNDELNWVLIKDIVIAQKNQLFLNNKPNKDNQITATSGLKITTEH